MVKSERTWNTSSLQLLLEVFHDAVAVGLKEGRLFQDSFRDGTERPVLIVDGVCSV